jgi:hypothetical protein
VQGGKFMEQPRKRTVIPPWCSDGTTHWSCYRWTGDRSKKMLGVPDSGLLVSLMCSCCGRQFEGVMCHANVKSEPSRRMSSTVPGVNEGCKPFARAAIASIPSCVRKI